MTETSRFWSVVGVGLGGGEEGQLKQMDEQGDCSRFHCQEPSSALKYLTNVSVSDFLPSVFKHEVSWFGSCQMLFYFHTENHLV